MRVIMTVVLGYQRRLGPLPGHPPNAPGQRLGISATLLLATAHYYHTKATCSISQCLRDGDLCFRHHQICGNRKIISYGKRLNMAKYYCYGNVQYAGTTDSAIK